MSSEDPKLVERKFLHDISSPLTTVKMTVEMMLEDVKKNSENEKMIKWLERACRNMDSAIEMIADRRKTLKGED